MWLSFIVVLNEPIAISLKPLHVYHSEASELASHVVSPRDLRPVPPFLLYPKKSRPFAPTPLAVIFDICLHTSHLVRPMRWVGVTGSSRGEQC